LSAVISVIIPVYNGAAFVGEAIESALAQQVDGREIVVVDDGSTDATPGVLASFGDRIRIVRKTNEGLSSARNAGIASTDSELLSFLDADDLLAPSYLASFLAAARDHPAAEVFHCGFRAFGSRGQPLYEQEQPFPLDDDPFHRLVRFGSPHITALCVRRRGIVRAGVFDETLALQEDWDYWLRLAAAGCVFRGVPSAHSIVRRRRDSMSAAAGRALALTGLAVLERQLRRHPRCPACVTLADPGLLLWRRSALNGCARDYAERMHLPGRAGEWLGRALAVAFYPRLAPGFAAELRARFADA
jgi:glycosyltransferase involved in cell wall biosynthesis